MRDRLILLVSCAALALLVYWGLDRIYFAPLQAADVRLAELSSQLDALKEREISARRDHAALRDVGALPKFSFVEREADIGAVTAQFQEYVRASVAEFGGTTASSQVMVAELDGGYSKISVLLRMRFAEWQLLEFARKVETDSPPVVFETLEVRSLPIAADSHPLDVTATLTGFYANADTR